MAARIILGWDVYGFSVDRIQSSPQMLVVLAKTLLHISAILSLLYMVLIL